MRQSYIGIIIFLLYSSFVMAQKIDYPSGTVKIDYNFYVDETEVSNLAYLEYLSWIEEIYGKNSKNYKSALPDVSVWLESPHYGDYYMESYLYDSVFSDHPVVGVTLKQVQHYCTWRSDRVYETLLRSEGFLDEEQYKNTPKEHFTTERFLSKKYDNGTTTLDMVKHIPIPEFRLPTPQEWESLTTVPKEHPQYQHELAIYGVDLKSYKDAHQQARFCFKIYQTGVYPGLVVNVPSDCYSHYTNPSELYNVIGNVAELTSKKGIAKGGSFAHTLEESAPTTSQEYDGPQQWLGFRCVCSWRFLE